MAGAEDVAGSIDRRPGVTYSGLVLNARGYERLAAAGLDEVHLAVAASETLNRRNQNASVDESLEEVARIVERAHGDGRRVVVVVAASFGCPFEGARRAGPRAGWPSGRSRPAPTSWCWPTRSASACPRQVRDARERDAATRAARRRAPA